MKGPNTKPTDTEFQQDHGSIQIQATNDNIPVVVNFTLPTDFLNSLPQQSPTAHPTVAPRGMPRPMAASYIGCSPRMFDGMVKSGDMPSPRLIGKKKVWDREELDEFFADLPRPQTNDDKNDWDDNESGD
jgi:hypothetical protein